MSTEVILTWIFFHMVDVTAWKVSVFGDFLVRIFQYSVRMEENTDQKNSEQGHFSRSVSGVVEDCFSEID